MKLQFKQTDDFIIVDKPNGFSTHSPDLDKLGICEIYEKELLSKLYIAQRLDKSTTGLLLLAKSGEAANALSELLSSRKVEKTYRLITNRVSDRSEYSCDLNIDGKAAQTLFKRIKRNPFFELWEALPKTGRKHQIRIHASHLNIPILGDTTYGGSSYPHLCLHSWKLKFPDGGATETILPLETPAPVFMDRLGLLKDPELVQLLSEMDRRQRLYNFLNIPTECLRLVHLPEIRIDMYGEQLWIYWYKSDPPLNADFERMEFISGLLKKKYFIKFMQNRGKDPNQILQWHSPDWRSQWHGYESNTRYLLNSELGQSPGLFLDQHHNRKRLAQISKGKKILNLFAYTCGFSVVAAANGASEVVSVDLSQKFLEWGKNNFSENNLKLNAQYSFFAMDVVKFLNGAIKHHRKFDIVICDPPSFGRSKESVFQLEKDFEKIVLSCWQLLVPEGQFLFSCNLEKWSHELLKKKLTKLTQCQQIESLTPFWDFEEPNKDRLMKSFWLKKKN